MGNSKIVLNDEVLIDLTQDTVSADNMLTGVTAHNASGNVVTGRVNPVKSVNTITPDLTGNVALDVDDLNGTSDYVKKIEAPGYSNILTQTSAQETYLSRQEANIVYPSKMDVSNLYVAKVTGKALSDNNFTNQQVMNVATNTEQRHTHNNKVILDSITTVFTPEDKTKLDSLSNFTLPTATNIVKGGVKIGNNISVDSEGSISVPNGSVASKGLVQLQNIIDTTTNKAATPKIVNDVKTIAESKQDPATTLQGYGIMDANIIGSTIQLGVNTVTPVVDASYVHTDENYTSVEKQKLAGIANGAEVNVQSDWNNTTTFSGGYIKNKPTRLSQFSNDTNFITTNDNLQGTAARAISDGDGNQIKSTYFKLSGGTLTGPIAMGSNKVTNLLQGDSGSNDAATVKQVENLIANLGSVLNFKGTKANVSQLPLTGNKKGDVWLVIDAEYVWISNSSSGTRTDWEQIGVTVDLEGYLQVADLASAEGNSTITSMTQKAITDSLYNKLGKTETAQNASLLENRSANYFAVADSVTSQLALKQNILSGTAQQIVGFDNSNNAIAINPSSVFSETRIKGVTGDFETGDIQVNASYVGAVASTDSIIDAEIIALWG